MAGNALKERQLNKQCYNFILMLIPNFYRILQLMAQRWTRDNNPASHTHTRENKTKYVWIDLEMTGLELEKNTILEIACLLTTANLEVIHPEGFHTIIHHSDDVLNNMDDWCKKTFAKNGLTNASRQSSITLQSAESMFRDYIVQHTQFSDTLYIAGNSIHCDKMFIKKYLPSVDTLFHYRLLDVSTIKILAANWYPRLGNYRKKCNHRAFDDIYESIGELKFYKDNIFNRRF